MNVQSNLSRRLQRLLATGLVASCGLCLAGQLQGQTAITPAMHYFAPGAAAQQSIHYAPVQAANTVHTAGTDSTTKPFQYVDRGSSITPYINLDLPESTTGIPNYYMFVKPHLDQRDRLEAQQRELQRLHRQAQIKTQSAPMSTSNAGRYRDLNSYYPGLNR